MEQILFMVNGIWELDFQSISRFSVRKRSTFAAKLVIYTDTTDDDYDCSELLILSFSSQYTSTTHLIWF